MFLFIYWKRIKRRNKETEDSSLKLEFESTFMNSIIIKKILMGGIMKKSERFI